MKTGITVLISLAVGFALGGTAVHALHAQAKPPAYVVGEIDIRNAELLDKEYVPTAAKVVGDGGGKYIVGGGKSVSIYGEPPSASPS
jgi:hypothetical protein